MPAKSKNLNSQMTVFRQVITLSVILAFVLVQLIFLSSVGAAIPGSSSTIFINEFHYDNAGTDTGEAIEIAGPAGTDLTGYSLVLYNGSNGAVYNTTALSGTIPAQQNGYGTVTVSYPTNGIQNGSPDGIAFEGPTGLIQFLCYEGSFTAVGGTADGQTCTNVGVSEPGTTAIGDSLQLSGTGTTAGDFTWTAPAPNTFDQPNTGQTFNGTGGTPTPTPTATPTPGPTPNSDIIINETDADTPGSDSEEFVELFDGGTGNSSLDGLVLVFFNGSNDLSYRSIDLDGFSTDSNGYFTAGNAGVPGVDVVFPGNGLQNGADAAALYQADSTDFPSGTAVTTVNLIDAIVYDTNDADDAGLLVLLNPGEPQVNENSGGQGPDVSNQRCPNGGGGARNTSSYLQRTPSPDADNSCPAPPVAAEIHEIQGNGSVSPFNGLGVITTGVVTARRIGGFFLQEPDASVDADPLTSEGIHVFISGPGFTPVSVGDSVQVTGEASEFFGLTRITAGDVLIISSGNPLPAPVVLTPAILDPAGLPDQLERFEGMRLSAASLRSVAPTNRFGEIYTVLDGVARPFREPGIEISLPVPPDPTSGTVDCCIPRWDENPERIMVDTDALLFSTRVNVTTNVVLSNVTGPLDFNFGNYKIDPETTPAVSANTSAVPVPVPASGEFTVAGFNIRNFNNDETQRKKAALAIRTVMRLPDIIGVMEIADLTSLEALAAQVNADTLAATGTDPLFEARLIQGPTGFPQNVGFLVKTSRIQIDSVTQEAAAETYINPNTGLPEILHDRPPLVLEATVDPAGADPRQIFVVVNHLRSFNNIDDDARVRAKRTAQAESTARILQSLQTNDPDTPVISVGDYNAFEFNDGFTDPISVIKGTPTADDEVVVDESPDLVDPDLINLTDQLPAEQRYSFIFEGTPQTLDHILVNTAAFAIVQNYAIARSNADFPESAEFETDTRPEVSSDHDMPVAYFKFARRATTATVPDAAVTYNTNGQNITLTADIAAEINTVNEGTVTFTVTTPDGSTTIGTPVPAPVSGGMATANFLLPAGVLPQPLKLNADFSGGDTTLASSGMGDLTLSYDVCLDYAPVKAKKSGSTYPIKLRLCDVSGINVSDPQIVVRALYITPVSSPGTHIDAEAAGKSNPGNIFRFAGGRYIFNLKTRGLSSGTYDLVFTAGDDPTIHTAEFRIK